MTMPMIEFVKPSRLPPGERRFGPHVTTTPHVHEMIGSVPCSCPMYSRYSRNETIPPTAPATIQKTAIPVEGRMRPAEASDDMRSVCRTAGRRDASGCGSASALEPRGLVLRERERDAAAHVRVDLGGQGLEVEPGDLRELAVRGIR